MIREIWGIILWEIGVGLVGVATLFLYLWTGEIDAAVLGIGLILMAQCKAIARKLDALVDTEDA